MRAQFIGKDRSMGFRRGQWYRIIAIEEKFGKVLLREASGLFCPYSNIGKMLENWKFDKRY